MAEWPRRASLRREIITLDEPYYIIRATRTAARSARSIRSNPQEAMAEITRVCESQELVLGRTVRQFEEAVAAYCQARYAVGCASGSDAITLALMAYGIGSGDRVLTVPFTFFATAGSIAQLGATPVFVDVEPDTFNMDVQKAIQALDSGRVSARLFRSIYMAAARTWIRFALPPGSGGFRSSRMLRKVLALNIGAGAPA